MRDLELNTLPFGGSSRISVRVTGKANQFAGKPVVSLRVTSRWSPAATADIVELIKRATARAKAIDVADADPLAT